MSVLQVTPSGTAGGRAPALEPVRSPSAPRAVLWVPPSGHLAVFTKSGEEPAAKQAMRGPSEGSPQSRDLSVLITQGDSTLLGHPDVYRAWGRSCLSIQAPGQLVLIPRHSLGWGGCPPLLGGMPVKSSDEAGPGQPPALWFTPHPV